jgi:hypothetical protein
MRNFSMLALVVVGLVACRGDDTGDDQPMPDGGGNTNDVTIQEIQNDAMPACDPATPSTCVELKLKGVVVTAIDAFGSRTGDFWIGEPGGGPYSGVQVYRAPLDQVGALQIGDVVDIAGAQKAEFTISTDPMAKTLTELEPIEGGMMTVTKTGASMPIQPTVVDALAIGQMTDFMAREAEWEKWEGVLVTLNNVEAFSNTTCITSMGNCTDMTYERFDITGDIQVQSSLAAMPSTKVARGDCLSGVTGILSFFFDYHVLPRTTAEIGTGGTACPVENTAATCGDSIDNNGNGFADCMDFSCQTTQASCVTHPTIAQIQAGTATGYVELDSVYVMAVSFNKKNLWVATSLTASPNDAIYVFRGNGMAVPTLDPSIVVGANVSVAGLAQEGNNDSMGATLTQIAGMPVVTLLAAPTTPPVPVTTQMASTLAVDATGEPYESVLVTLTNVKITVLGAATFYVGELQQGTTKFLSDDDVLRLTDPVGTCYSTVTGIWTYQVFDNKWGLLPISTTPGGTCP